MDNKQIKDQADIAVEQYSTGQINAEDCAYIMMEQFAKDELGLSGTELEEFLATIKK